MRGIPGFGGAMLLACLGVAGCDQYKHRLPPDAVAATPQLPRAVVRLKTVDGRDAGEVSFVEESGGVRLVAQVAGLTPGPHGFHVHSQGQCAPGVDGQGAIVAFGAAGGHFDPRRAGRHGHPDEVHSAAHAGDMPNLVADASGRAVMTHLHSGISLSAGATSIVGRAVVVHAEPDDYRTDPAGNSGARVLCGVVERVG